MKEYIEREDLLDLYKGFDTPEYGKLSVPCPVVYQNVLDVPAADVRPVVRAYWKSVPNKRERVCSRCEADEPYKFADDDANVYNYCPHCGARMDGGVNDGT